MKCGVSSFAATAKHGGRLDPAYYLGDLAPEIAAIRRARKALKAAKKRLAGARRAAHDKRGRHRRMLADGDVTML